MAIEDLEEQIAAMHEVAQLEADEALAKQLAAGSPRVFNTATAGVRWSQPATVGPKLLEDRLLVKAETGQMPNKYGGVLGEDIYVDGITVLCFNVKSNDNANIAIGVADACKELTETSGPHSWGLYLAKGRLIQALNSHRIAGPYRKLYRSAKRKLYKEMLGSGCTLKILFIIDMTTRRMSVAIGDELPVDTGFILSDAVRPWVWLAGPGCGSVSIDKIGQPPIELPPAPVVAEATAAPPRPMASADDGGIGIGLGPLASLSEDAASFDDALPKRLPSTSLSPKAVTDLSEAVLHSSGSSSDGMTARTDSTSLSGSLSGDGPLPERWSETAAAWLLPLQQALGLKKAEPDFSRDGELSA